MTAAKPKHFDQHPRLARKKQPVAPIADDLEARLLLATDEKTYREILFRDFCLFCRNAGAWVISTPFERRCRVMVPDGSALLERLAQLPRYPVVKLPGVSHHLSHGRFIPVTEIEVQLWR